VQSSFQGENGFLFGDLLHRQSVLLRQLSCPILSEQTLGDSEILLDPDHTLVLPFDFELS
jgi:hypothetical protein